MHEKAIPGFTRIGSTATQPVFALRVRRTSPQLEAEAFTVAGGDPENEPPGWSPLTGAASKITAYLDDFARMGADILRDRRAEAPSIAEAAGGEWEAIPYPEGVPPPEITAQQLTQAQTALARAVPHLGVPMPPKRIAGHITLSDGRRIPVEESTDPLTAAEHARSDLQKNALRPGNYDAALERAKLQLKARQEAAREDEFSRVFAIKERHAAQQERIGELQERALELAIERETSSPAQRALWGRPSTISPEPPRHRTVKQIGPGVPGGIQERLF